jgi:hypothetical protein
MPGSAQQRCPKSESAAQGSQVTRPRQNEPRRHSRRDIQPRPDGAEKPIGRRLGRLSQARVPGGNVGRGGEGADDRCREADGEENDEGQNMSFPRHGLTHQPIAGVRS